MSKLNLAKILLPLYSVIAAGAELDTKNIPEGLSELSGYTFLEQEEINVTAHLNKHE
jgi:hypothetical protein